MKFRASLTDKGGEIHGKVEYQGDYASAKEVLLTTIESISKSFGMTTEDLLKDLYWTEKGVAK